MRKLKNISILIFIILNFHQTWALEQPKLEDLQFNDLGNMKEIAKPDMEKQILLETRASKLQTHQYLGIATLALLAATAITAKEHQAAPSSHEFLGYAAGLTYMTTAYFSLTAPDAPSGHKKGWNVTIHKSLAWVHFPLMILTPIAGAMASRQYERGEALHGLAKEKGALANALLTTVALSALTMTIEF